MLTDITASRGSSATRRSPPTICAAGVLDSLSYALLETGGAVEVGTLPTVEGDAAQLGHVRQNLICEQH